MQKIVPQSGAIFFHENLTIIKIMTNKFKKNTDEELAQFSAGNIEAFEELISRYEKKLSRYISRIANFSEEENEEILQEIFIKVWKNINSFSVDLKFSSWIYRIAHNETISIFRKAKSRGISEQVELTDELFIPDKIDFVKEFDEKISSQNIQNVLLEMDTKSREILVLKFLEEQNYEEISDILKLPLGTIATRINRAKKNFRDLLITLNIKF
jgi:RNA polymerase sigma-70 factor (ECF subfamily)